MSLAKFFIISAHWLSCCPWPLLVLLLGFLLSVLFSCFVGYLLFRVSLHPSATGRASRFTADLASSTAHALYQ